VSSLAQFQMDAHVGACASRIETILQEIWFLSTVKPWNYCELASPLPRHLRRSNRNTTKESVVGAKDLNCGSSKHCVLPTWLLLGHSKLPPGISGRAICSLA